VGQFVTEIVKKFNRFYRLTCNNIILRILLSAAGQNHKYKKWFGAVVSCVCKHVLRRR